ncbi:MAG: c-type cytochrome [Burkholderiales bacterium]|jgi:cytochrome c peroxidase|nr:c-type cytochrome [Burkholderiales bacterium]
MNINTTYLGGNTSKPSPRKVCGLWAILFILGWLFSGTVAASDQFLLGLPPLDTSHDTPAKIALGKKLFFDTRLSSSGTIACSSCHVPEKAFTDELPLAKGVANRIGTRNTPTIINAAFNTSQFWDGRRPTLEEQSLDPIVNQKEHGLKDIDEILKIFRQLYDYTSAVEEVFGVSLENTQPEHLKASLAAFERTIIAGDSAFDRYYFLGDTSALSKSAERGYKVFTGHAQCSRCHLIEKNHALLTDNKFHRLSIGLRSAGDKLSRAAVGIVNAIHKNENTGNQILSDEDTAELGYFVVTQNPNDIGKFRTPSLRNVALTAPYMHDGSIATLEDAIEWEAYYRSDAEQTPLFLTPEEKEDLAAFLKSLTSSSLSRFEPRN